MYDILYKTTVMAARRLFKSRLRKHIYGLQVENAPDECTWRPLLQLEEGFEIEAQQSWQRVLDCWASGPVRDTMLDLALGEGLIQARFDVWRHFRTTGVDPIWLQHSILQYSGGEI